MPSLGAYLGPLFAHAAKARLRETSRKWLPLVLISRGTLYLVTIGFGFALGRFADPIMSELGANPLGDVLGRHFVLLLLGLAATRGFFPARTRLDVEPYRYYPLSPFGVGLVSVLVDIPRWPLLAYVAGIVGVGLSDSQGVPVTGGAAVALVLLGVSASALGSAFREALIHRGKFVLVSVIVGVLAILTDGLAGSELLIVISQKLWLFVLSDVWAGAVALSIVMLVLLLCARVRSAVIKEGLTHEIPGIGGVPSWTERALTDWRPAGRLALLEALLLWRCRYPRNLFRGIGILLTLLVILAALDPDDSYRSVTTLFVTAGLAAAYGQYIFAWNSDHIDGLLALPIRAEVQIAGRWILGSVLALVSALALVGANLLFGFLDIAESIAMLTLTVGAIVPIMIFASARTARPVRLDASGFSNLSAFSWSSYAGCMALWFSTEILLSFSSHRMVAILYGAIGAIGLLALRPVLQFLGHDIEQRIPSMAERLRAG